MGKSADGFSSPRRVEQMTLASGEQTFNITGMNNISTDHRTGRFQTRIRFGWRQMEKEAVVPGI